MNIEGIVKEREVYLIKKCRSLVSKKTSVLFILYYGSNELTSEYTLPKTAGALRVQTSFACSRRSISYFSRISLFKNK